MIAGLEYVTTNLNELLGNIRNYREEFEATNKMILELTEENNA